MHILVLPSWYKDPERPGSGVFFKQQAVALAKAGNKVAMVYVESRSLRCFSIKRFFTSNHFQLTVHRDNGVLEYCRRGWSFRPQTRLGGKMTVWINLRLIEKYIKNYGKPDIIHAHSTLWAGYIAKCVYEKYGIPYVLTEHATGFILNDFPLWQHPYIQDGLMNAKSRLAVGASLLVNMKKFCADKPITVFPNFIDTTFFQCHEKSGKTKDGFIFFSLGNLIPNKGYDILLRSFYKAFKGDKNTKLFIGGSGYLLQDLKQSAHELELQDQVFFLGQMTREEVREYMNYCDVFVLGSRIETFGVVFAEAMAAGKPVIGTRCGGPENFINDGCGYLVNKEDVDGLATALSVMKKNISNFDSAYIRRYIYENFDEGLLAQKLTGLYKSLL